MPEDQVLEFENGVDYGKLCKEAVKHGYKKTIKIKRIKDIKPKVVKVEPKLENVVTEGETIKDPQKVSFWNRDIRTFFKGNNNEG